MRSPRRLEPGVDLGHRTQARGPAVPEEAIGDAFGHVVLGDELEGTLIMAPMSSPYVRLVRTGRAGT